MHPLLIAAMIGAGAGVVAALCGVGGGIVMVPAFVALLGLPQKNAVATSLTAIILISVVATVRNGANGFVDWKVALVASVGGAVVAWFAADALKVLSNATLTRIFALLLIGVGFKMLFQKAV